MLLIAASTAGAQEITQGTILALDRKARLLVLEDRTVWALELMKSAIDAAIEAGDHIEISYELDEEGVSAINHITTTLNQPTGRASGQPAIRIACNPAESRRRDYFAGSNSAPREAGSTPGVTIESILQLEPELRRVTEVTGKPLGDGRIDAAACGSQLDDRTAWQVDFARQLLGAEIVPDQ